MIGNSPPRATFRLARSLGWAIGGITLLLATPAFAQPRADAAPAAWASEPEGITVHKPTGAAFPSAYGGFRRGRTATMASDGSDASISYHADQGGGPSRVTIFLFRPHGDEQELKEALSAIAARSPDAYVWADGPFAIPAPQSAPVPLRIFKGVYKTGEGPRAALDYLYLAKLGAWSVKIRATAPDPAQEEAIDRIVRHLPWEAILKANGPCEGPSCKTRGPTPFNSHLVESLLPNLLLKGTKFDPAAERNLPVVGRAATPPLGDAVIRRSTRDPVVYVARVKDLGTFRLIRVPQIALRQVEDAFRSLSIESPVYAVAIDSEGAVLMPRLFTGGEPTAAQFGAVVSELVLHSTASPFVTVRETAAAIRPGG